ncbi:MAG: hypothetical protein ACI4OP_02090 [Candidatus Coprovivens sp.]
MSVIKEKFILTLSYEMSVDTSTGEILETKLLDKKIDKPSKDKPKIKEDDSTEPILTLESSKFSLNSSAIKLMNLSTGDKIDIKYEDGKDGKFPVIGVDEAFGTKGGNKLTGSNTVAFRGNKNTELAKYGTEFKITPHPNKSGLFILSSGNPPVLNGDENVNTEDFDLDLDNIEEDTDITEIDASFFKL